MKIHLYSKFLFVFLLVIGLTPETQAQFGKNNGWFYYPGVSASTVKRATTIRKTDTKPTIDGQIEDVWNTVPWNPCQYYSPRDQTTAPTFDDAYMEWKGLWDEDTYYLLIHVIDDQIAYDPDRLCLDFSCGWWNMDGIELYGNPTNDDLPLNRDDPPNHWVKLFAGADPGNVMIPHVAFEGYPATAAVTIEVDSLGRNHIYYEYQDAPWDVQKEGFVPEVGGKMRIELQLQDNDPGEEEPLADLSRDLIVAWADSTDANDNGVGAAGFGEVTFGDETVLSNSVEFPNPAYMYRMGVTDVNYKRQFVIPKAITAPTIDGEIDDEVWNEVPWTPYQVVTQWDESLDQSEPGFDDFFMEWKAVWDDETVYFLIHVADDVQSYKADGNWWWQDALEFYVRGAGDAVEGFSRNNNAHTVWHVLHPAMENPGFVEGNRDNYGAEIGLKLEEDENGMKHAYWEYKDIAWTEQLVGTALAPSVGDSIRFSIMANEDDDLESDEDTERDYIALAASVRESLAGQDTWPVLILGNEDGNVTGGSTNAGYQGVGYAAEIRDRAWEMPGALVDSTTGVFIGSREFGYVDLKLFDVVGDSGPDIKLDSGQVFGIYPPVDGDTPGDTGGQDIRGYDTKSNADSSAYFAPIRFNGGAQNWRQSGNWARYTVNIPAGTYNFVYRGDIRGFAQATHKFDLKIYEKAARLQNPVYEKTIDLTDDFPANFNDFKSGILNLGGGNDLTDWLRDTENITIEEGGDYVVEIATPYFPFSAGGTWGEFTFNLASEVPEVEIPYTGISYANNVVDSIPFQMPGPNITELDSFFIGGTIDVRQFDVATLEGPNFALDTAVVFGIYPPAIGQNPNDQGGQDIHGYDTKSDTTVNAAIYQPLRFNGGALVWRGSGKWTRYTVNFQQGEYKYVYRGDTRNFTRGSHKYTLKIYEPNNIIFPIYQRVIDLTGSFPDSVGVVSDNVENLGGGNSQTDWFRSLESIFIPATGNYIVEIDEGFFPYGSSIYGEFSFEGVDPLNSTQKREIVVDEMKVYPNPTSNWITVESLQNGFKGRMDLFSIDGRLMKSRVSLDGQSIVRFDTSNLVNGTYLIRLVTSNSIQTAKVVVRK